eukprot:5536966-Alexandrium_andersonii.AAC.1
MRYIGGTLHSLTHAFTHACANASTQAACTQVPQIEVTVKHPIDTPTWGNFGLGDARSCGSPETSAVPMGPPTGTPSRSE